MRNLSSAVAVTPFVLGTHMSVEERYPGGSIQVLIISRLSSPIKFSLRNLSLYMWLLALNVVLQRLYLCLCLTLGPSLVPLNACMCRGCLAPMWEDLAQKSLSDFIALSPTDELVQR